MAYRGKPLGHFGLPYLLFFTYFFIYKPPKINGGFQTAGNSGGFLTVENSEGFQTVGNSEGFQTAENSMGFQTTGNSVGFKPP